MLFVGHGSPMNAVEDNDFTRNWTDIGKKLPRPKAILAISAHWYTNGTRVQEEETPRMVYDMYGFPEELYQIVYPAKGSTEYARKVQNYLRDRVQVDNSWGIDHGTWSVLTRMFPNADIPVIQLSVDANATGSEAYEIGKLLAPLREEGVLIFASGNVVHNLREVNWGKEGGETWAEEFDGYIKELILEKNYGEAVQYRNHRFAQKAVPTSDHYNPLLYVLGACDAGDRVSVFNEASIMGSLSMTSYLFEN